MDYLREKDVEPPGFVPEAIARRGGFRGLGATDTTDALLLAGQTLAEVSA
ncbi:hypothetical protein ACVGOW_27390 [Pseudonocardia saturnea]